MRVDLPTLGLPMMFTNPDLCMLFCLLVFWGGGREVRATPAKEKRATVGVGPSAALSFVLS
jgi:hypothetical protein